MKNEYIVAIDYSANYKPMTIDYKMLKAENLLDAMNEAEQYMDKRNGLPCQDHEAQRGSSQSQGRGCTRSHLHRRSHQPGQWLAQHPM